MRLRVVAVGRLRPVYRAVSTIYRDRLQRYISFDEVEVREASRAGSPEVQRREEAKHVAAKIPPHGLIVALARSGTQWESVGLATRLDRWMLGGRPVALLLGGSTGLDENLLARADHRWSLGRLTLPHELARVIVLEQLYRACTVLHHEPYHKGR